MKVTFVEAQTEVQTQRLDTLKIGDFFEFVDHPGRVGVIMEGWKGDVTEIVRLTGISYVVNMAYTSFGSAKVRRLPAGTQIILEAE